LLPHERSIKAEFRAARDIAAATRALFDADAPVPELQAAYGRLKDAYLRLKAKLPPGVDGGNADRHLGFMEMFLQRAEPQNCRQDAVDIEQHDILALEQAFENWSAGLGQYDELLRSKVVPLLERQEYDSAIRKAFVHLKARLVTEFRLSRELDGDRLYGRVFGRDGPLTAVMDGSERESLRALLCALFTLFRHEYAHDDVKTQWHEVETVLVVINYVLIRVQQVTQFSDSGLQPADSPGRTR